MPLQSRRLQKFVFDCAQRAAFETRKADVHAGRLSGNEEVFPLPDVSNLTADPEESLVASLANDGNTSDIGHWGMVAWQPDVGHAAEGRDRRLMCPRYCSGSGVPIPWSMLCGSIYGAPTSSLQRPIPYGDKTSGGIRRML